MSEASNTAVARLNQGFLWANATSVAAAIGAAVLYANAHDGGIALLILSVVTHTSTLKVTVAK